MNEQTATILLTGATGGIGQAAAKALAKQGVNLVLQGRNQECLARLLSELDTSLGQQHQIVSADLTLATDRQRLIALVNPLPLTGLINLAGVNQFVLFEQQSAKSIEDTLFTNVTATMLLTQGLISKLKLADKAVIVNVGSILGAIGHPGYVTYCTSKFALRGFSEALARELADSNIKVKYLAPRTTSTSINSDAASAMNQALGNHTDSPQWVASQLLALLQGQGARQNLGWPEKLFVAINGLLPNVVDKSMNKNLALIKRFLVTQ